MTKQNEHKMVCHGCHQLEFNVPEEILKKLNDHEKRTQTIDQGQKIVR